MTLLGIAITSLIGCSLFGGEADPSQLPELSPGTYQYEEDAIFTKAEYGFDGTGKKKVQFQLNLDKTFLMQGYLTVDETTIQEVLSAEERGKYSQSKDTLIMSEQLLRNFNFQTSTWGAWAVPSSGEKSKSQIRNVTNNTFQIFNDEDKKWNTLAKL